MTEVTEVELLKERVAELERELAKAKIIINMMDKWAPRADSTCVKPGIKLSTAMRHQLRDDGHPLFAGQPAKSEH